MTDSPTDTETVLTPESLAERWHHAWEWQYGECDHGTYSGGPSHGEPYKMCEIMARRIHGVYTADGSTIVIVKPQDEKHEPTPRVQWAVRVHHTGKVVQYADEMLARKTADYHPDNVLLRREATDWVEEQQ